MPKWSGKTPNNIHELEINFSNLCGANCLFCSRHHGNGNDPIMEPETFNELVNQLKDVKFNIVQTSGNGETFTNPNYLDYVRTLKQEFPDTPRWIYNNFLMMNKTRADIICDEQLFERVHTRVDSLIPWVFKKASNLNFDLVMRNIDYFLSVNQNTPLTILYNDVNVYYKHCQNVIGKRPSRDFFTDEELAQVPEEFEAIKQRFKGNVNFCKINPCLWGERDQAPPDPDAPCPKINVIEQVTWVLPNGDITVCCYDDSQDKFIAGNIHEEHILDIFYGERRKEWIRKIKNREIKDAPCQDPKCCSFGGGIEAK